MWASVDDVALVYGQPLEDQAASVEFLLDTAHGIITDLDPALPRKIAEGRVARTTVRYVLCNMVTGVLRNPDGLRQEADGDYSHTFDAAVAAGRLRLSRSDAALLRGRPQATSVPLMDWGLAHLARNQS